MADVAASQRLRFFDAAFYAIAVGVGMRWVAVAAAVGPASLPLWTLALFTFYFPLAAATAELTARFEGEGGIYIWARDALGPLPGFLCGWFYWISLMPFFAGILIFGSGLIITAAGGDPKNAFLSISVSLVISLLVTAVQLAGLKYGKWLPNIGTSGAWIVFAMVLLLALVLGVEGKSATDFLHSSYLAPASFDTAILWGTMVFAYSGVESLGFLRNEIDGGMRSILRVLVIVGIASLAVYVGGTCAFLIVLPKSALTRLSGFPDALRLGFAHVGFAYLGTVAIALFAVTMLGAFTAWFGVGARLPFAAGIDNFLPPVFARRNPRTGAPVAAILLQAALMVTIMVISQAGTSVAGAYDLLLSMSILSVSIPYVFLFAAYAKCARMPLVPDAWVPAGGRKTSGLLAWTGLVSTIIAIGCTLVPNSGDAHPLLGLVKIVISTLVMMTAGLLLYWLANSGRRRQAARA